MKHAFLAGCLVLLMTSCSLFRQKAVHRSVSVAETRSAEKQRTETTVESEELIISSAALESGHRYQVQIIPEGSFHYSPGEGFSGKARQVTVRGNVITSSHRREVAAGRSFMLENVLSERSEERDAESRQVEKRVEVERKGVGGWWVWLVGLVVLFLGWRKVRR